MAITRAPIPRGRQHLVRSDPTPHPLGAVRGILFSLAFGGLAWALIVAAALGVRALLP